MILVDQEQRAFGDGTIEDHMLYTVRSIHLGISNELALEKGTAN